MISEQPCFDSLDAGTGASGASGDMPRPMLEALPDAQRDGLVAKMQRRIQAGKGPLTLNARANALCGIRP